jgi:hypothetical protein
VSNAPQQRAAIDALLERSKRDAVPIRRSFTQQRVRGGGPGPLSAFVTHRRRRALDLYLLAHAAASARPYDVTLESRVWARLLGLEGRNAGSMITRQWNWLEEHRLVTTSRKNRLRSVVLLREDGSGLPYTHPGVSSESRPAEGDYFNLPHAYWKAGLPDRIDLPTKAVLLIALSRPTDDFILPIEHASRWYGMSPDSLSLGLRQLQLLGFLAMRFEHESAPLSPRGYRTVRRYTLRPPFGPRAADTSTPASSS